MKKFITFSHAPLRAVQEILLLKLRRERVFLVISLMLFCCAENGFAQTSRQYIRNEIETKGARNVAITKTGGDLMLYGRNGYAYKGIPQSLSNAMRELHDDSKYIDDIQLTESGDWLILWGDNGFKWNNIPYSLEEKIRYYNKQGEVVTCAAFNDYGDWIVVTTEHFSASDDSDRILLKEGIDTWGALETVCLTNDCLVAVFDRGYRFRGNVPESLKTALRETSMDVYRLKVAGGSWFIADKEGHYRYYM